MGASMLTRLSKNLASSNINNSNVIFNQIVTTSSKDVVPTEIQDEDYFDADTVIHVKYIK